MASSTIIGADGGRRPGDVGSHRSTDWTAPLRASQPIEVPRAAMIVETPMISGDIVASGSALAHPNLQRPVMNLDGLKVAPLIRQITPGISAEQTVERWSRHAGRYQCQGIFQWLWRRSVVVPSASP